MPCIACGSNCQEEFDAELILHFSGIKNLDEPGLWVSPKLLICLNCGYAHFTIQEPSWRPVRASLRQVICNSGELS